MLMDLGVMISHLGGREKSMGDKWERNEEHLGNGRESRWNSVDGKSKEKICGNQNGKSGIQGNMLCIQVGQTNETSWEYMRR